MSTTIDTTTTALAKCWACGHSSHEAGKCNQLALFTKKPCECSGR